MSEAENLYGEEHVRRYRETAGDVGHRWKRGSKILLLTTKGRKSGEPRTKPLIYEQDGDRYVIVASKGGAEALVSVVVGWIARASTRVMLVTRGRIGWRYFEWPQAIKAA